MIPVVAVLTLFIIYNSETLEPIEVKSTYECIKANELYIDLEPRHLTDIERLSLIKFLLKLGNSRKV